MPTTLGRRLLAAQFACGLATAALTVFVTGCIDDAFVIAVAGFAFYILSSSLWFGVVLSIIRELLVPRMRATATAFYLISITFTGFALGPYTVGLVSDLFQVSGSSSGESLAIALTFSLVVLPFALLFFSGKRVPENVLWRSCSGNVFQERFPEKRVVEIVFWKRLIFQ